MLKSFENRDGWIWMNGKIIPWQDANSHVISQGLHYASAVFEGERAYNGKIFKSEEHTKRFFKSAEIIGMEIPFTHDQINKAKYELIDKMNYKNLSKEFAEKKGYHDALMLDYRGYVAEGTGANIFFIKDNNIHTPIPDCFLNGITRQTVIEMATNQGFEITEKHLMPDEIGNYDEAFLTGTAAEITPIKSIDDFKYNTGDNTTTFKFMNDFSDMVKNAS